MVNLAAGSWTKYRNFNLKSRKYSWPKKVVTFFAEISPAIFFGGGEFSSTLKPNSERSLGRSQAYIPISRWCYGEHLRKFIRKPRFCSERWSTSAQSIARFGFAAKKHTSQFFFLKLSFLNFFIGILPLKI
jgi:hypothetical protein